MSYSPLVEGTAGLGLRLRGGLEVDFTADGLPCPVRSLLLLQSVYLAMYDYVLTPTSTS